MSSIKEYNYNEKYYLHDKNFLKKVNIFKCKYYDKIKFKKKQTQDIIKYIMDKYSVYDIDTDNIIKYEFFEDLEILSRSRKKEFYETLCMFYERYDLDKDKIKLYKFVLNTQSEKNKEIFDYEKERILVTMDKKEHLYVHIFIDKLTGLISSSSVLLEDDLYIYRSINEFDYRYITNDFIRYMQAIDDLYIIKNI